jgi:Predicted integral membrane protein (DUF2269)
LSEATPFAIARPALGDEPDPSHLLKEASEMSYDTWVALHVLGVVIFIGNLVVTAVWKTLADRTRVPHVVAYAQRLVTDTDVAFTATGAALTTISGFALADDWGASFGTSETAALLSVGLTESLQWNQPFMKLHPSDPERVLLTLVRFSVKAIERHRDGYLQSAHPTSASSWASSGVRRRDGLNHRHGRPVRKWIVRPRKRRC